MAQLLRFVNCCLFVFNANASYFCLAVTKYLAEKTQGRKGLFWLTGLERRQSVPEGKHSSRACARAVHFSVVQEAERAGWTVGLSPSGLLPPTVFKMAHKMGPASKARPCKRCFTY